MKESLWKQTYENILIGMGFVGITLNFLFLNQILPFIGVLLVITGFRKLRRENQWFQIGYAGAWLKVVITIVSIVLGAVLGHEEIYASYVWKVIAFCGGILPIALVSCFFFGTRQELRKRQMNIKYEVLIHIIIWYVAMVVLAAWNYQGLILALIIIAMVLQPVAIAKVHDADLWAAFKFGIKNTLNSMAAGANNMAGVALATASAGIIVGCVSLGLGQQITSFVEALSMGNIFLMILITAVASLLLGMGLPTTANYIIMASLTAPVIVTLATGLTLHGQEIAIPLIAAHLFCLYFGILADDTPPVGLAAYAGAAIAKANPISVGVQGFLYDIRTAIIPVFFLFNSDILLIGIESLPVSLMIFAMTGLGMVAVSSAIQGWLIDKVNILERLILVAATVVLMFPALISGYVLPYEQRWWGYLVGIALFGIAFLSQKVRYGAKKKNQAAVAESDEELAVS